MINVVLTQSITQKEGHHHEDIKTEFIRLYPADILTNPIQLSPSHMIYKAASNLPIPASSIKIGDVLKTVNGTSKVES